MIEKKVIIIVGGAGLIGKELTSEIVKNNAYAVVLDKCFPEQWNKTGIQANSFIQCDITNKKNIDGAIETLHAKFKKIDAVINAAYPKNKNYGKQFFDIEYIDLIENVSHHLGGFFLVAQSFTRYFIKQGFGNIINIASIYGLIAPKFDIYQQTDITMPVEYAMVKSAIIHFTKYLAKYFKGKNIRVNCISPGGVRDNQPSVLIDNYNKFCLSKGMLDPSDICNTALFLLSDISKFINGQNIIVDDGFSL